MHFHGVKRAPEIRPIERSDQSLVAEAENLSPDCDAPLFASELKIALAQIEGVVTFGAHYAGDVRPIGKKLPRVLPLRINLQPFDRLEGRADAEALQQPAVVGQ